MRRLSLNFTQMLVVGNQGKQPLSRALRHSSKQDQLSQRAALAGSQLKDVWRAVTKKRVEMHVQNGCAAQVLPHLLGRGPRCPEKKLELVQAQE